jgi:hypothetical protein
MNLMALLGSRLKWNLISVRLEIVLILMDDSCMVWAKRTMALVMRTSTPIIHPRRPRRQLLVLLLVLVLEKLIIK